MALSISSIDLLRAAPFDPDQWPTVVRAIGEETGSSFAQLAGWSGPGRIPLNIAWNEPDGMVDRWLALGGADPAINPVVRVGQRSPELLSVSDAEILTPDERRTSFMWNEFYEPSGFPHICFTPVRKHADAHLLLVVLRTARQGPIDAEARRTFSAFASRCREAAMVTEVIGREGARVLAGAFDGLSLCALALDRFGRIVVASASAEAFVRSATVLKQQQGRLTAVDTAEALRLDGTLAAYLTDRLSDLPPASIAVRGPRGDTATLKIVRLPRTQVSLGYDAAALVVVSETRPAKPEPDVTASLTATEREIALLVLAGKRPAEIARLRGVSHHTVRSQVKSVYAKAGVSGAIEFIARVRSLSHG